MSEVQAMLSLPERGLLASGYQLLQFVSDCCRFQQVEASH